MQESGAVYAQSSLQWSEHLRTVIGIRGDRYHFHDDADNALNGGARDASLASPKLSVILGPWHNSEVYADAGSPQPPTGFGDFPRPAQPGPGPTSLAQSGSFAYDPVNGSDGDASTGSGKAL